MGINVTKWRTSVAPTMSISGTTFYTGLFRHSLDDKNRVTIPSLWRSTHADGDVFLATCHPSGYIAVLPPAEVDKLREKVSQVPLSDTAGQDFLARFFSTTQAVSFDSQGRMMFNADLLRHAGIGKEVVLTGTMNKFFVYSPDRWVQATARTESESQLDVMRRVGI